MTEKCTFTWSTRRDGNSGYVLEQGTNKFGDLLHSREYGPMPCHIVLAFVEGRRRIVAQSAKDHRVSYAEPEEFNYLEDERPN